ncbi:MULTISPECIES: helix-turn-helix domain-containing protein [Tsukamurella]|uniref:Helix-turn-helix domain-containing protein n=1 Tax=Tsukamurella strandjordii TaxID=147577 RepID=A0AA90SFA0_9ACTN|nr:MULTISPECIES: helix-turn-helix domain-containing protein [Tsukamurella]MDP0396384.1 helix-turn-helix domain-containing protein [Tsukamurella strandjordii]GIZ96187.1 hypothetical protein TTY48_07990 [Tsukamurella sp. TY48]
MSETPSSSRPLSERLRFLFEYVYPRGREPFTPTEVVDAIRREGGSMTTGHLSQLMSGKRSNPGLGVLLELAGFFHVPLDYFADDELSEEIRSDIIAGAAVRDSGNPGIAARRYDPYRRYAEWTTGS